MSDAGDALDLLRQAGAVLDGHFRYASGRHGPMYVEKFRLLEDPVATSELCKTLAAELRSHDVELVVGPTTGGVIVGYEMARQLGLHSYIAERDGDGDERALLRGFVVKPGQRTLIVDDVLTTGGSVRQTIAAVERAGGLPVAVGVLIDRSGGRTHFGLPFGAGMTLDVASFASEDCAQCAAAEPLIET
ncbi:MAG: orotate phosphoribosyltransferase [Chloroflexi bacterium]|nr:MAG: orotate phosphoribosyltransferase [Chloroflexota bacterium]